LKAIFKNKFFSYFLLGIFCAGIFFINRYGTHGWGDDFALYLMQAEKTAQFRFQQPTFYVFNPLNSAISPSYYPPLYPAFLSIFYYSFSGNIANYILLHHFLLVALVFVFFYYLKRNAIMLLTFLFCLLLLYNPWVLYFKNQVASEFFFMILLVLLAINVRRDRPNQIHIVILCSMLVCTRSMGWVALSALAIALWRCYGVMQWLFTCLLVLLITFIFVGEIFSTDYIANFRQESLLHTVRNNFVFYSNVLSTIFIPHLETRKIFIAPTKFITLLLFAIGVLYSLVKKQYLFETLFTLFYLLVLLVYPHHSSGFRYLFPIVPFMLFFVIVSLQFITKPITSVVVQKVMMYAVPLFLLLQYKPDISYIIKENVTVVDGPNSSAAVEMFSAVQGIATIQDTVYFIRPKALGLYARRYAKALPESDQKKVKFLVSDNLNASADTLLVAANAFDTVWHNNRFVLYKRAE
jgi:hypothetical protein